MKGALRRWSGRLGLVLGGLLVGLLLAELGARLASPDGAADLLFNAPEAAPQGLYRSDPTLLHEPVPGKEGAISSLGYSVPIRFNSLGLRGPEVDSASPAPRWLMGGDSFTLALQVLEEQTFTALLGERRGWQALNAGVDGYSSWSAGRRYARLDDQVGVQGLLLTFFLGNDIEDNEVFFEQVDMAAHRPAGMLMGSPGQTPVRGWLLAHSYLYGRWRVAQRAQALDPQERERFAKELKIFTASGADFLRGRMWESSRALRDVRETVRRRGDLLMVAIAPPAFVVDEARAGPTLAMAGLDPADADLDAPGLAVEALLNELGVASCPLTGPLREAAAQTGETLYLPYDGHWSAAGHRVVADALDACLTASGAP